jgi:hypothetical protein
LIYRCWAFPPRQPASWFLSQRLQLDLARFILTQHKLGHTGA